MSTSNETKPPNRRRGFRVSLRVFMLLILAVGVWLGWKTNKARRIRRAVAEVQRLGGTVWYDYQLIAWLDRDTALRPEPRWIQRLLGPEYFHDVHSVNFGIGHVAGDGRKRIEDLGFLSDLSELRVLEISNSGVDDAAFRSLGPLPRLRMVSLHEPRVGDAGLAWLSSCRELQMLTIASELYGDETARRIGRLSTITVLELYAGRMTDEGVEALSSLGALTILDLYGGGLGDRSLAVASGFANLEQLSLGRLNHATTGGFGRLASLAKLMSLRFRGPSLAEWDLDSLAGLTSLTTVDLSEASLGRSSISARSIPPSLRTVSIHAASIADGSLDAIAKARALTSFCISDSELSDVTIRRLRRAYPALRIIRRKNGQPRGMFSEIDALDLL